MLLIPILNKITQINYYLNVQFGILGAFLCLSIILSNYCWLGKELVDE